MARKIGDINAKIAYITNPKSGPILKMKRPLYLRDIPNYSSKRNTNVYTCQDEVTNFYECMKQNDYQEQHCVDQLKAMLTCEAEMKEKMPPKKTKTKKGKQPKKDHAQETENAKLSRIYQSFPNPVNKKSLIKQRNIYQTSPQQLIQTIPFKERGGTKPILKSDDHTS